MSESLIVSGSGIRGIVGQGLTSQVVARYGAAFADHILESGSAGDFVLVGRDSRTSGAMFLDAVCSGIEAVGLEVRDMGIVATPTGLLAVENTPEASGGVLVTASHNPAEWNGLKLVSPDGRFISREAGLDVQRRFEEGAWRISSLERRLKTDSKNLGRNRIVFEGANRLHREKILALPIVDVDRIVARRFRVALDCVRGAGGLIMPQLLEQLGCSVIGLDIEADGCFPRAPDPVPENLGRLAEIVIEEEADFGFAVDPDVDRLSLVDERGRAIGEDWTLSLVTEMVAVREPGPVVTNLSSSRSIADAAMRAGAPFYYAPVGEANVVKRMVELGATIGGEGNGGVVYPTLHLTRDAPLAAALILQFFAEQDATLGAVIAERPNYHIIKRKIPRGGLAISEVLSAIEEAAPPEAERNWEDGIRIDWPDGSWINARPSGTEPILRVVAEAEHKNDANMRADWVESHVRGEGK